MTHRHRAARYGLMAGLALAFTGALIALWSDSEPNPPPELSTPAPQVAQPSAPPSEGALALPVPATAPVLAASSATQSIAIMAGQEPTEMLSFRLDAQGRLVHDERTRLDIEKLFVLNEPAERARKLALLQASLPPDAARELGELASRYGNYQDAVHEQLPPGLEVSTRAEAQAQFERLRKLREQYFGSPLAARLFGAEEAQTQARLRDLPEVLPARE
jgi:Proteobacterial lipase chaperone protein